MVLDTSVADVSFLPMLWRWAILVGPIPLLFWGWDRWVHYVQELYILNLKFTMLEVRTPQNVDRSPEAMEMFINSFHQTGGTGSWEKLFWMGRVRTWFSLEIASIEGNIYFFIRCETKFAEFIKSQIYGFYPEAEVTEVDDYTKYVPPVPEHKEWDMWATEYKLAKPDGYPIKTYKDYQLEKQVGLYDNQKFDPLSSVLSFMAMLKPGEQFWLQIIIRASTTRHHKHGEKWKTQDWRAANADVVHEFTKKVQDGMLSEKDKHGGKKFADLFPEAAKRRVTSYLSTIEKETFDAIQRKMTKNAFDTGIRAIYLARKENMVAAQDIFVNGLFRLFASDHLNSLIPTNSTDQHDYKWESPLGVLEEWRKEDTFKAYIHRSFFYPPFDKTRDGKLNKVYRTQIMLNAEELATIFHFPGKEVSAPTISRVDAKKSEPPANLPVG